MSRSIEGPLTDEQIAGIEHWLAHVDPNEPVAVPGIVVDSMQALIEEVRDRRRSALALCEAATDRRAPWRRPSPPRKANAPWRKP